MTWPSSTLYEERKWWEEIKNIVDMAVYSNLA